MGARQVLQAHRRRSANGLRRRGANDGRDLLDGLDRVRLHDLEGVLEHERRGVEKVEWGECKGHEDHRQRSITAQRPCQPEIGCNAVAAVRTGALNSPAWNGLSVCWSVLWLRTLATPATWLATAPASVATLDAASMAAGEGQQILVIC